MQIFKFSKLSEKAKQKAVLEYIDGERETREENDLTSYEDAYSILKTDLEEDARYSKDGKYIGEIFELGEE